MKLLSIQDYIIGAGLLLIIAGGIEYFWRQLYDDDDTYVFTEVVVIKISVHILILCSALLFFHAWVLSVPTITRVQMYIAESVTLLSLGVALMIFLRLTHTKGSPIYRILLVINSIIILSSIVIFIKEVL